MVNFQSRTGLLLLSGNGDASPDQSVITPGEQKRVILNRNLSIMFEGIPGMDDTADILEVIAGEIRRGRVSGNEIKFSWTIGPSLKIRKGRQQPEKTKKIEI